MGLERRVFRYRFALLIVQISVGFGCIGYSQVNAVLQRDFVPSVLVPQSGQREGTAVAVNEKYAVTTAPFTDAIASDEGMVKVYDSSTGALRLTISNPNQTEGIKNGTFGAVLALSGNYLAVAESGIADVTPGTIYIFDLAAEAPGAPKWQIENTATSLAFHGNRLVAGDKAFGGRGKAYIYDLTSAQPTRYLHAFELSDPALSEFGFSVALEGVHVVVGAPAATVEGITAGQAFIYDISGPNPTAPVLTFSNPSPALADRFGASVAIAGGRAVIGTRSDDTGAPNAGSAYVYNLSAEAPSIPSLILNNPAPIANRRFGAKLALHGATLIVGADDETGSIPGGIAYAYDLSSASPGIPLLTLSNPTPAVADKFGLAVSVFENLIVVGNPFEDSFGPDSGAAYLYSLTAVNPTTPIATLAYTIADPAHAGSSVATNGAQIFLGVPGENSSLSNSGAIYVFDLSNPAQPSAAKRLTNPTPGASDRFGEAIAASTDHLIVGASGDASSGTKSGAAYLYEIKAAEPMLLATIQNPTPADSEKFGEAVAISGNSLAIAAKADNTRGSVYLYDISGGGVPSLRAKVSQATGAFNQGFGQAVALNEEFLVVGDVARDHVYIYSSQASSGGTPIVAIPNPSPAATHGFGHSVSVSNGILAVGAPRAPVAPTPGAGTVYVFDLHGVSPSTPILALKNPDPESTSDFGTALSLVDSQLLVSTVTSTPNPFDIGIAYLFDIAAPNPTAPIATILNPIPAIGDRFGQSVALTRAAAIIGAPRDDTAGLDQGAAYLFDLQAASRFGQWKLEKLGSAFASSFGDPDVDGTVNVAEYALLTEPEAFDIPVSTDLVQDGAATRLRTFFRRDPSRTDVSIEVQSATDPGGPWTTIAFSSRGAPTIGPGYFSGETGGSGIMQIEVRDVADISASAQRFLRIQITVHP
jgi:hypothetical protein